MKKEVLIGSLLVLIGAFSYSVLASLVKLAYGDGFSTAEITFSQYLIGLVFFGLITGFNNLKNKTKSYTSSKYDVIKLIIGGSTLGFTGIFYYYAVQHLPVSICVVLLMQSTWIGVVIEAVIVKKFPSLLKIAGCLLVLVGTILATNAINNLENLSTTGLMWGCLSGITYAVSLAVSNKIATDMMTSKRSFYMLVGAFTVVAVIGIPSLIDKFNLSIFWLWGLPLAIFGTVIPPFIFNKGMPKTGIGLGSILISIEIPASIGMAYLLLDERITMIQWSGIVLILFAIALLNLKMLLNPQQKAD